ncbi:hypothetical protein EW093_07265 [Thiospirochaeta perfilievii]|uniref:Uncharacterized protein n=1 Tax=Thiospirochaeta perfilievii TaxID=252967 RepID=A0A5C1QAK4_9SPIO|nr:hypothetical protein [Thiospirochaeta perfilievii]QEN04507.1 hypothetical protein EW093_07265 [Thiospirochaeta perfilievii]
MKQTREIIRLNYVCNLSDRAISNVVNLSRPTIAKICKSFSESGLEYDQIKEMSDSDLSLEFYEKKVVSHKAEMLIAKFPQYAIELKKKGSNFTAIMRGVYCRVSRWIEDITIWKTLQ